ncbi:hypothetical protein FHG87_013421 [Trinorchestia longiramus]|nr:hypothetical protein FHG87_013421 [Trinorchestia longiramus]
MLCAYTVMVIVAVLFHDTSGNRAAPTGLLTADMFQTEQFASGAVPKPVQVASSSLSVGGPPIGGTRKGRHRPLMGRDEVPIIEGVRVPDDPSEKNIIYRNARIINNILVTDEDVHRFNTSGFSQSVEQGLKFGMGPVDLASLTLPSEAISSLSSLAKLVLNSPKSRENAIESEIGGRSFRHGGQEYLTRGQKLINDGFSGVQDYRNGQKILDVELNGIQKIQNSYPNFAHAPPIPVRHFRTPPPVEITWSRKGHSWRKRRFHPKNDRLQFSSNSYPRLIKPYRIEQQRTFSTRFGKPSQHLTASSPHESTLLPPSISGTKSIFNPFFGGFRNPSLNFLSTKN